MGGERSELKLEQCITIRLATSPLFFVGGRPFLTFWWLVLLPPPSLVGGSPSSVPSSSSFCAGVVIVGASGARFFLWPCQVLSALFLQAKTIFNCTLVPVVTLTISLRKTT